MEKQGIKSASTVLLCKTTIAWPYKILLLKRSKTAAFLPGAHVFPGGRIDAIDTQFSQILQSDQKNLNRIQSYFKSDVTQISKHIAAAVRETLEESGLSFLKTLKAKNPCHINAHDLRKFISGQKLFTPLLDNIWPISWWVTPKGEARRYNTWFFLATIDDGETTFSNFNDAEFSEQRWLFPHEALLLYKEREIFLAPPTRAILERMNETASLDQFLAFVDKPLWPIHPLFVNDSSDKKLLVLPGDPLHTQAKKSSLPLSTRYAFP